MIADFNGLLACYALFPPPIPISVWGEFYSDDIFTCQLSTFCSLTVKNNNSSGQRQRKGLGNVEEACPSSSYRCRARQRKWTPELQLHVLQLTYANQDVCALSTTLSFHPEAIKQNGKSLKFLLFYTGMRIWEHTAKCAYSKLFLNFKT